MNTNITNCIVVGLIAIVLVLFLYYNNPLLEQKTKEGFETTTTSTEGETTTSTEGEVKQKVNNSLRREYIKTIFSMDQLNNNDIVDGIKKNIIFTTRKIKDINTDYIDVYDIEDDTVNINGADITKIEQIRRSTGNDNISKFIKRIRLIGNENGDFTKVDRNQDFFLNMVNGVSIDMKFVNNYIRDFKDEIETETLIKELMPNNFEGTVEDKKRYKDYSFNTSVVEISKRDDGKDEITLTLEKEINIGDNKDDNTFNYLTMLNEGINEDKNKCKSIFAIQKCVLNIILNEEFTIDNNTNFKDFVENINIPESSFSYGLGFRYIKMDGNEVLPVKGIYNVSLYLNNVEYQTYSMNEWLQNEINEENQDLLNKKLEEIITPMFDLDNEIEKRSKVVKRIHDIYRFNKLNNSRNTMRFYNSHY